MALQCFFRHHKLSTKASCYTRDIAWLAATAELYCHQACCLCICWQRTVTTYFGLSASLDGHCTCCSIFDLHVGLGWAIAHPAACSPAHLGSIFHIRGVALTAVSYRHMHLVLIAVNTWQLGRKCKVSCTLQKGLWCLSVWCVTGCQKTQLHLRTTTSLALERSACR